MAQKHVKYFDQPILGGGGHAPLTPLPPESATVFVKSKFFFASVCQFSLQKKHKIVLTNHIQRGHTLIPEALK
jgi:hypothetical protein